VEKLTANVTTERLPDLMLPDMTETAILAYELAAAVIASVGRHVAMRVHVRSIVVTTEERALAQVTLKGFVLRAA
jgi:hypothetical protein